MPDPKRPRHITVQSLHDLSPHLRRIVFHSPELADYPFRCSGSHIKIMLPQAGQTAPVLPEWTAKGPRWADDSSKPVVRTYTLRSYDASACTLAIDFVRHGDNGPASRFAEHAAAGQTIGVSAPVGPVPILKPAADYLIAGDLCALPAICAMFGDMPKHARGRVFLHLPEAADMPSEHIIPAGVTLHPFFGASTQYAGLVEAVASQRPPQDNCYVWLAGEAEMVSALRTLAKETWRIPRPQYYAVPYWRQGESEELYHRKRHDFLDSDAG